MQITRLRLLGFKSFVEPTELLIGPGLTGVVGPNGCGKSNLLEALRWVMGETSYKTMRASAMDDVIFAGTDKRPARNMAEVMVAVDNTKRTAPAAFNDADVLEISRRIQREAGSVYKVNGKEVRAKDVQILFADAATGARSQAMVQQGTIGQLINAKPQDRRRILEDAAGIAGLYTRRHEAELRLKAAEANLERLKDVLGQLGNQLSSLRRQARQAQKYRELTTELRKLEAMQHHLHYSAANVAVQSEEAQLLEALRAVGQFTQAEAAALRLQAEAADALQPLRDEEATRAAVLHRIEVERNTLDREEARAKEREAELRARLVQVQADAEREDAAIAEARELLEKFDRDEEALRALGDGSEARAETEARAENAMEGLNEAEDALNVLTSKVAELRAERRQLEAQIAEHGGRAGRFAQQEAELSRQLADLRARAEAASPVEDLREDVAMLEAQIETIEGDIIAAEEAVAAARLREKDTRDAAGAARLRAKSLETEVATLIKLLKPSDAGRFKPIVDQISVSAGYEVALGAALGDDLDVTADQTSPTRWTLVSDAGGDPALPYGAERLSNFVRGPLELSRRLAQIGVVASRDEGERLKASLAVGQRLVTREGDLWRWDGFVSAANAPSAAARRLAERNRLAGLEEQLDEVREAADRAEAERLAAQNAATEAQASEKRLREAVRASQAQLAQKRATFSQAERAAMEEANKLRNIEEARERAAYAREEAEAAREDAQAALEEARPVDQAEAELARLKERAAAARDVYTQAKAALDDIDRDIRARAFRLKQIGEERLRWLQRTKSANAQINSLAERLDGIRAELAEAEELPAKIADRRNKILMEIGQAETARKAAADQLAAATNGLREADRSLRDAQSGLSTARETRARIEARLEAARERRAEYANAIRDTFECQPPEILSAVGLEDDATLPSPQEIEQQIVKLKAERERLGGVNLRAEEEAAALGGEFDGMEKERSDLQEAIGKLRTGIASLNKEGRKRLLEAFDTVQAHFVRLFQILFGGGEAELQLIESDDPLESGLEIFCRPPGKKPQVLTLLSGGEKALTALALIFAVFLTNPSPICVLDEVDAPLDDANVDRFCTMMEEMARSTETRFLVITHHPMTMARMNRLFGVTMQEKGISQLVSVDLQAAERFREAS
ncbi:chromosome segregation protein SMC [Rhodomicrobium vannielii ATCC 17100]|uniref:Chromosome partition protein Smc n=1 Tax=Rhodomicrobium vannielii (strain ATCC 17100 / DSM 162 / LMG 4299 / NCIMB 10020 / ATH 3.1.1) TaxID=648757 RepID=E3I0B2_RHOVT|nr:AAA family ATPase [Rhodomicrobium vannielii]ADP72230.1 chromosome segregation protein SMC [Rhodomicrobium vannielii ATCC 17100]